MHMHTHIHTYIHTYIHIHTHTHLLPPVNITNTAPKKKRIHTSQCLCLSECMHVCVGIGIHVPMHPCIDAFTQIYVYTHTHTHTETRTQTHTSAHCRERESPLEK
jgi:hypothetical protein